MSVEVALVRLQDGGWTPLAHHGGKLADVRWDPGQRAVASTGTDGTVRLWVAE